MREENNSDKIVYLAKKLERPVPLTHYSFITTNSGIFKAIKDKSIQEEIKKMPAPKLAASEEKIVKNQFVVTEVELNSKCTDCNKPQFTLTKNEHKFTPCICYAS